MLNITKISVLLERQKESGLSVRSFCSNECIAPSSFYYWKKKIKKETVGQGFIPLVVQTPRSSIYPTQRPEGDGMGAFPMEIAYPNGTTLRIKHALDLAGLRSLILLVD
ncbi:MAG: hypothetical protein JXN62_09400 [Bacteroidales bacterium]|nr:hypothetical protein [Bacteroidales bacterium]